MEDSYEATGNRPAASDKTLPGLDLYWIPIGAGADVVRIRGTAVQLRAHSDIYHSALVATTSDANFIIEMTPIPGARRRQDRGVVSEGPVGSRRAPRLRIFRYEIRRWRNGVIPDISFAVASPVRVTDDVGLVEQTLDLVPFVPTPVWGRDELHAGGMWTCNSVVSWLLTRIGLVTAAGQPPGGGRAPGWAAGVTVARHSLSTL
ncbi:MAG: hypothetical protein ABSB52_14720 [Acidimicrobiales bacterium]